MQMRQECRRVAGRILVALVAACVGAVCWSASAKAHDQDDVVLTDKGPVRGLQTSAMHAFLGIPYAAAPIGDLRWQPPRPPARWHAPLNAVSFGGHCPQTPSLVGKPSTNEDCLFLNVFTPGRSRWHDQDDHDGRREGRDDHGEDRRPVMVWIHGGGLTSGESDDYDPVKLVEQGVVVVTINYRLGILGFFAHPALTAESPDHISGSAGTSPASAAIRTT
jgi:para-nitrobenzyl esterase